ncbi:MAG: hypothetical protein WBH86_03545 [Thermogutta sp.]|nr:hypothetical protein [Thermogutta sp.]HOP76445.1 hypothetical protein [Thermogutta sp.]HPU06004.1 hypothetical protein [Thermogutta sp.]
MAYWLAIEWNNEELRAVAAVRRRDRLVIEHAFAVPLTDAVRPSDNGSPESREQTAENIGKRLAAALAARGIRRPTTFVAISRSLVELRQMSVPPVSDEELPDLVRFQALREFTHVNEDWLIDYLLLDEDPSQPRNALVAALAPELFQDIQKTCQIAKVQPERIVLRPCATASLANRCVPPKPDEIRLLVDLLGEEVDLSVVVGNKLVFMRTARVTGDPLKEADALVVLVGEIRRTMMAAQNQLGGGRANHLVLCGQTPAYQALGQTLRERLDIETTCFDPFSHFDLGPEVAESLPDHPGRFTPLLGVLADEQEKVAPAVDFLHPHRRPEPPSQRNRYALAGLGGLLIVVLAGMYGWLQLQELDSRIAGLRNRQAVLDRQLKQAAETRKLADAIQAWSGGHVNWLEELRRLNEKIPPAEEVMLGKLTMASGARGGEISLEGFAARSESIEKMEQALDDQQHRVISKGKAEDDSQKPYKLRFGTTVVIVPPSSASTSRPSSQRPATGPAASRTTPNAPLAGR